MPTIQRQMSDDSLNKKLEELATKNDIDELKDLVNGLHKRMADQNKMISSLKKL